MYKDSFNFCMLSELFNLFALTELLLLLHVSELPLFFQQSIYSYILKKKKFDKKLGAFWYSYLNICNFQI